MRIRIGVSPLIIAGATLSTVSGACWGYLFATKELEDRFDSDLRSALDTEIDKVQRYYAVLNKTTQPEDHSVDEFPEDVVVDTQNIIIPKNLLSTPDGRALILEKISETITSDYSGISDEDDDVAVDTEEPVVVNAFDEQALLDERSDGTPYIISKDEYLSNHSGYQSYDLTFFEGDGVLVDDQDNAVPDTDSVVGDRNLQRFGWLSGDNNMLYVKNDASSAVFAIARDGRTVAEAIYGIADEDTDGSLSHSSMKRRRPRQWDE